MSVLVTGAAGFIGFHVCRALLRRGHTVVGVDLPSQSRLQQARTRELGSTMTFRWLDLADRDACEACFAEVRPSDVVHLAARVGVRASTADPHGYVQANVTAFMNVLASSVGVRHLVYASSSSVYGAAEVPFREGIVGEPLSIYAATKRADELLAASWSRLRQLPCTGLRLFTVYGPWGRPDMAVYRFAEAIAQGRPIQVFDKGEMLRDFTYAADIAEALCRLLPVPPQFHRITNVGAGRPEPVSRLVDLLEAAMGQPAIRVYADADASECQATWADLEVLESLTGYRPTTALSVGIPAFVEWYRGHPDLGGS